MGTVAEQLTGRLRAAADYLARSGWTQYVEQDSFGQVCLTGAIRYCAPRVGDEELVVVVQQQRDRAERWNDVDGRFAGEVLTELRTAEVTDVDLAATFGPQWEAVVGLVRRAAALEPQEVRDLFFAWRDGARDAARNAALDAVRGTGRDSVWITARMVGRNAKEAVSDAVGNCVAAVAVRDLIGKYGFTQDDYDVLTAPWRTVVGPAHPEDDALPRAAADSSGHR